MPDPSTLRDSTQIVLPSNALEGVREDLIEEFTLTLYEMDVVIRDGSGTSPDEDGDGTAIEDGDPGETVTEGEDGNGTATEDYVRIIGSPVEIKAASDFLSRHGVRLR